MCRRDCISLAQTSSDVVDLLTPCCASGSCASSLSGLVVAPVSTAVPVFVGGVVGRERVGSRGVFLGGAVGGTSECGLVTPHLGTWLQVVQWWCGDTFYPNRRFLVPYSCHLGADWASGDQWAGGRCVVPRGRGSGC